jgi:hypothetical protein
VLLPLAAFVGGVAGVAATYALGRSAGGRNVHSLILAGVAVAAFLSAVQTYVNQRNSESLREVYGWILGRLLTAGWDAAAAVARRGRAFAGAGLVRAICCGAGGLRGNCAVAVGAGAGCGAREPGSRSLNRFGILGCASSSLLNSMEPSEVRVQADVARRVQQASMTAASRAVSNRFV